MKKIALAAIVSGLGWMMNTPKAMAYAQHEHPFVKSSTLSDESAG
jgi:hypothetical protein